MKQIKEKKEKTMKAFVFLATVMASHAYGYSSYFNQFVEHYNTNGISTEGLTDAVRCGFCHVSEGGGGRKTAYGESFRDLALGERLGFPGLEFIDSDADGYLNLEEIYLNTNPGSEESKPAAKIAIAISNQNLVLQFAATCKAIELKSFGFKIEGKESLSLTLNAATASLPVTGNKGAVLVKCQEEKFVGSLLAQ